MKKRCLILEPFPIPKCCRQPRSHGAPRPPHQGSLFELSSCNDGSSSTASASEARPVSMHKEDMTELSMVRCSMSPNKGLGGVFSNFIEAQNAEVESVTNNAPLDTCHNGNNAQNNNDRSHSHSIVETLPFTPDKSMLNVTESVDAWLAPGSVVWAKSAYHEWWPAEVKDEREVLECTSNQCDEGLVLVQLYGSYECAWVDPVKDLSQFDYCYEERSSNPLKEFQDALKQALLKKEHASSSEQSDKSSDKWNISSSSRTNEYVDEGRGKRKRKPKVHFDELAFPEKSMRRVRRMRIMRYLGLTAPIGSPFSRFH